MVSLVRRGVVSLVEISNLERPYAGVTAYKSWGTVLAQRMKPSHQPNALWRDVHLDGLSNLPSLSTL